ncbi:MAG: DUF2207 domain-containing protein [Gemmatimonadetes bacterium]|nr:DUF2207 domain-containing protein [Gemmatimonadota bacterium]
MRTTPILTILLFTMLATLPLRAQQRSLSLATFDADIQVAASGAIEVTETLRPRFTGSWNGIFRNLSLEHRTGSHRRVPLRVELVSITDETGNALRFETESGAWSRRWQIWVPGAVDATRTVVIRYRVSNALRFFDAGSEAGALDELYWNVTGNGWDIPIEEASASIRLPEGVRVQQLSIYTGVLGSQARDAVLDTTASVLRVRTTRPLSPGDGLTIAVGWPLGVIQRPENYDQPNRFARLAFAAPLLALFFAYRSWHRHGRDPERMRIMVHYEPPDLTPAEAGTLVDHTVQMHDLTAMLVDLAVRGWIHIEEAEEKKLFGLISSTEYVFHRKHPKPQWSSLKPHEQKFLEGLFEAEKPSESDPFYGSIAMSDLTNKFYARLSAIRESIYDSLIAKGHYDRNPVKARLKWTVLGIAMLALSVLAASLLNSVWVAGLSPLPVGIGGALAGVILIGFGQIMPARTVPGARAMEHALGFREFLSAVEEDRYRRMITSPELFERYLPYAMAFRVESRWAKAFDGLYTQPPDWYTGDPGALFSATSFTRGMSQMSTAVGSSMSSSPSGSGGGGGSGGGSGGGGGGGF